MPVQQSQPKNAPCQYQTRAPGKLTHDERIEDHLGLPVDAPDPPLVSDLDLEDPQLASGNSGLDQVVLATLVTIGCM